MRQWAMPQEMTQMETPAQPQTPILEFPPSPTSPNVAEMPTPCYPDAAEIPTPTPTYPDVAEMPPTVETVIASDQPQQMQITNPHAPTHVHFLASIIAAGYTVGQNAMQKAKEFDQAHMNVAPEVETKVLSPFL